MGWPPGDSPLLKEEDPDKLLDWLTNPDNEPINRDLVLRNAVRSRDWLIAEAQLRLGADAHARDEHGLSAMDYAGKEMREKIAAWFSEKHTARLKALRHHRRGPRP